MDTVGFVVLDEDEIVGMELFIILKNRYGPDYHYERATSIVEAMKKTYKILEKVRRAIILVNWYESRNYEKTVIEQLTNCYEGRISFVVLKSKRINEGHLKRTRFHKTVPMELYRKIEEVMQKMTIHVSASSQNGQHNDA